MSRRRHATEPAAALRLVKDIERASLLAHAAGDEVMTCLFTGTAVAARNAMDRGRRLLDAPDSPGYRLALEENTAELMAWTPVVQQVHVLAARWLTTAGECQDTAGVAMLPTAAVLRDYRVADPTCTGGPRDC